MRDESVSRVDETNSVATSLITTRRSGESTRRIGPIHDEMIWEVDETNSVHNETNRNNDSTTRNANLVSDLTSYHFEPVSRRDVFKLHSEKQAEFTYKRIVQVSFE